MKGLNLRRLITQKPTSPPTSPSTSPSTTSSTSPPTLPSFTQLTIVSDDSSSMSHIPQIVPDLNDSYEGWLWSAIQGKTLGEWIDLRDHYHDVRPLYGEKSTERKATTQLKDEKHEHKSKNRKLKDVEHKIKERERRERHKIWQGKIDSLTSDFCNRLAVARLPGVKKELDHQPSNRQDQNSKDTGKDEQLLSAIFAMILSNWIIRIQSELLVAQDVSRQQQKCDCETTTSRRKRPMLGSPDRKMMSGYEFFPCRI